MGWGALFPRAWVAPEFPPSGWDIHPLLDRADLMHVFGTLIDLDPIPHRAICTAGPVLTPQTTNKM
jgi:hypothetical protein